MSKLASCPTCGSYHLKSYFYVYHDNYTGLPAWVVGGVQCKVCKFHLEESDDYSENIQAVVDKAIEKWNSYG